MKENPIRNLFPLTLSSYNPAVSRKILLLLIPRQHIPVA
jgi:hypothetical protein